jgi:hypothetical protein
MNGPSYKRLHGDRPEMMHKVHSEPHDSGIVAPLQQHQGFRVLGKRSFAAASALIATVGLINLAKNDAV